MDLVRNEERAAPRRASELEHGKNIGAVIALLRPAPLRTSPPGPDSLVWSTPEPLAGKLTSTAGGRELPAWHTELFRTLWTLCIAAALSIMWLDFNVVGTILRYASVWQFALGYCERSLIAFTVVAALSKGPIDWFTANYAHSQLWNGT